jgi:hypothetical protein
LTISISQAKRGIEKNGSSKTEKNSRFLGHVKGVHFFKKMVYIKIGTYMKQKKKYKSSGIQYENRDMTKFFPTKSHI